MGRFFTLLFVFICVVSFGIETNAQVTNLKINGQSGSFVISQDIGVAWDCDIPTGQTATFEILMHINGSTFIDPSTDKNLFGTGMMTDGDTQGNNGPPDMDGTVNGHMTFTSNTIILAPGSYTFIFANNGVTTSITGTVVAMASPAYTIAGKFTPGSGQSAKNILILAKAGDMIRSFGMTDASGNYVINCNSAVAGLKEKVSIQDNIQPYVVSPSDTSIAMSKSWTGINFTAINPDAKLVGYLKTESGSGIASTPVRCYASNSSDVRKEVYTDANGMYMFGFSSSELSSYPIWDLEIDSQLAPTYVAPISGNISIHTGDSLKVDLLAYTANSTITGHVYLDGKVATGQSFSVVAYISDTVSTWSQSNTSTGEFTIYVTTKLPLYAVGVYDVPDTMAFDWNSSNQYAPGATGVVVNISTVAWKAQTSGNASYQLNSVAFPTSTVGFAAGNSGSLLGTVDGGTTWTTLTTNSTADINAISFINSTTGWFAGTTGAIKKTTNGGSSWVAQNSGTSSTINALQFTDANNGWATAAGTMIKTTNGGSSWATVSTAPSEGISTFTMLNATTGYLLTGWGNVYKTTDGGTSWTQTAGSPAGYSCTRIKFPTESVGYVCGNGNTIQVTTDGGSSWTPTYLNSSSINDIFAINATTAVIVGYDNTIYKTTNSGTTWVKQLLNSNNMHSLFGVCFSDANNGWAVGVSGIILHTTTGGTVDVREIATGKAASFVLAQNYPNPFNPTTVIDYAVPQSTGAMKHVTLKIYNMLGQEVAVLVDQAQASGSYRATFNGAGLSSGIYLYSLRVDNQNITKKMMLLK